MKKKEVFFIVFVLALSTIFYFYFFLKKQSSDYVVIKDLETHKVLLRQPLDTDGFYTINVRYGKFNIEVKDGKVLAKNVDCPNKVCEKMGPLGKDFVGFNTIICIPNGIEVLLEVGNE